MRDVKIAARIVIQETGRLAVPVSDTIVDALRPYAIGDKLRALRLRRKMGLLELARHTGLSAGLLSKIERGRLVPTIPTLTRIALVFSVGLDHFFSARTAPTLVIARKSDRQRLPARQGDRSPEYYFESLDYGAVDRRMNAYYAELEAAPPGRARTHAHPGAELIYVIGGTAVVTVGETEHRLDAGDSMYFDPSVPHAYRREGSRPCAVIVVTVQS